MKTLTDLARSIEAAIKAAEATLDVAADVEPHGHRVEMVKTQIEAAKDVLVKARGFCAAKASGTFSAAELAGLKPKKP